MKARARISIFFLTAVPISCLAGDFFAVTPSGAPEEMFAGKAQEVGSRIASRCMDLKWTVVSNANSEVVCESPLSSGQSVMGQLFLGNSYSTPPRRFFRFNISDISGVSRVQASGWVETQMAFGQMKRVDFSGADFHNSMMNFMTSAGGVFLVGTTFPNHAFMGIMAQRSMQGRYAVSTVGEVTAGSPADRAGMQVGDVVTEIAGRKFKDEDGYIENLNKAARTPTYEVAILRNGKPMALTFEREYRPASTQEVRAIKEVAPTAGATASPISVADELAKLVSLKEQGILTQEEFDSQKTKLLAR